MIACLSLREEGDGGDGDGGDGDRKEGDGGDEIPPTNMKSQIMKECPVLGSKKLIECPFLYFQKWT